GVERIRLGSLEPAIITDEWVSRAKGVEKLCEQFHLSLQSGSDGVLKRMRRRYTSGEYLRAARLLQDGWEDCALTTDVIAGFPGETDEEAIETEEFVREVGFAKLHVFPYSRRAGTVADKLPGQIDEKIKRDRCQRLITIGNKMRTDFVHSLTGKVKSVLFETDTGMGMARGYTKSYVPVTAESRGGALENCLITAAEGDELFGEVLKEVWQ
ncbi:MAG: radical SAM protein, partial [Clostridia bacterium]|nr:radical SAM protein [Clostridia bacterium]